MNQAQLGATQATLAKTREELGNRKADVERVNAELRNERQRSDTAVKTAISAQEKLMKQFVLQSASVETVQASIDSIYKKVLKRPRIPGPDDK